jgi:hypothetical protein
MSKIVALMALTKIMNISARYDKPPGDVLVVRAAGGDQEDEAQEQPNHVIASGGPQPRSYRREIAHHPSPLARFHVVSRTNESTAIPKE